MITICNFLSLSFNLIEFDLVVKLLRFLFTNTTRQCHGAAIKIENININRNENLEQQQVKNSSQWCHCSELDVG